MCVQLQKTIRVPFLGLRTLCQYTVQLFFQVKAAKAVAAKERKTTKGDKKTMKSVMDEKDEFDLMADDKEMNKSLTERLGITPEMKKKKAGATFKQTKLDFKPAAKGSPKKKGKNPWSDEEVRRGG